VKRFDLLAAEALYGGVGPQRGTTYTDSAKADTARRKPHGRGLPNELAAHDL